MLYPPINFKKWIDENRHLLKPPVGNKCVWEDGDYIVMVVGGPNARKDYHYNETPEFFYQIEGDISVKVMDEGVPREIPIREGEIFLLPPRVPHSPQRGPDTVGLVIETKRPPEMLDAFEWYCEQCGKQMYREELLLKNIVTDLPRVFERYYGTPDHCTCQHCGAVMAPPVRR